jgi:hypothetical protein
VEEFEVAAGAQDDMDALQVFLGDVAAVRGVKAKKALV